MECKSPYRKIIALFPFFHTVLLFVFIKISHEINADIGITPNRIHTLQQLPVVPTCSQDQKERNTVIPVKQPQPDYALQTVSPG